MANSPADSNPMDRLSNLPDALLITIISFLPTRIAARTSVLCRRFHHLWEASPSLELISKDFTYRSSGENFVAMLNHALLRRNPSHHLLSLRLDVSLCGRQNAIAIISIISSFLANACSLDLRHLTMEGFNLSDLLPILPIVFTINSLRFLSLRLLFTTLPHLELNFPSGINLTSLRSLSVNLLNLLANFNQLLSELCSLEDLDIFINCTTVLSLSSKSIKNLKLAITISPHLGLPIVDLSLPSLESLHLKIYNGIEKLSHIHGEVPLLRKAMIKLYKLHESSVKVVAGLLNCISHVEELSMHLTEREDEKYPIPILLESIKDVPEFPKLEHLDLTLCFHEHNLEAVNTMLHKCPALKSLKLVHEVPNFTGLSRGRKRKDWKSRLPRNADGNYRYAYFKNIHLEENRKEVIKLLSKKCSPKRQLVTRTLNGPTK